MFKWQTISLARIESLSKSFFTEAQFHAARAAFLAIDLREFPVPTITYGSKIGRACRTLIVAWIIDGREWVLSFDCCGNSSERTRLVDDSRFEMLPTRDEYFKIGIRARRDWLLHGDIRDVVDQAKI